MLRRGLSCGVTVIAVVVSIICLYRSSIFHSRKGQDRRLGASDNALWNGVRFLPRPSDQ